MLTQTRIDTQIEKAEADLERLEKAREPYIARRDRNMEALKTAGDANRRQMEIMEKLLDPTISDKSSRTFEANDTALMDSDHRFRTAAYAVNSDNKALAKIDQHIARLSARILDLRKKRNKVPA